MEAENDEETKGHGNTFSLQNILFIVQVSAALAVAGYCGYPTIVNLLEGVILWFDWFRLVLRNIFFIFIILNALIGSIYFTFLKATVKKKPSLYDEYITDVPSVISSSPETSFAPMEVGYFNNSSNYQESVQPAQAVDTVEESSSCYERVVMETNSKCYRKMMRSEKKMKKTRITVEYQRKETERVMKTASCRSQAMMDGMSSEEFRMTVETFIMEKKMMYDWRNGVVDQCQNGACQLQNGVYWQNGVPQLQNGEWQNGFPQLQNGFDQWQGQPSRSRRLVGGSGSTCNGRPYLTISN